MQKEIIHFFERLKLLKVPLKVNKIILTIAHYLVSGLVWTKEGKPGDAVQ
jgi:hypothetical protein